MAHGSDYTQIVILGGSIESYWAALACASQLPGGPLEVTLLDDPAHLHPVVTAGGWLEELHELLGISHQVFLQAVQPRLSLGVEVIAAEKNFFIPATKTGFPYKHCSFSRLYAALGSERLGPYFDYNYAYMLHRAAIPSAPRNAESALCDGLEVVYHFDSKQYKQFLLQALQDLPVSIYAADAATIQRDSTGRVVGLKPLPALPNTCLLIDMCWAKNTQKNQTEIVTYPSPGFFAINQLRIHGIHCVQRINFRGSLMVETSNQLAHGGEEHNVEIGSVQTMQFWEDGQIKMGAEGGGFNMAASWGRVFFQQLQALLHYWPSQKSFAVISKKFNREWNIWRQEAEDIHNLILVAAGGSSVLTLENKRKIDLFIEVGALPHIENAIFTASEWENILVAGLGIVPGSRGLPRDIFEAEGLAHSMRIKESYSKVL